MVIEDQRRWFVVSPQYAADGAVRRDVTMVEAVSQRQAIVLGVKRMRAEPARYGWPVWAETRSLNPVVDVTASPVDEDDIAVLMATGRAPGRRAALARP